MLVGWWVHALCSVPVHHPTPTIDHPTKCRVVVVVRSDTATTMTTALLKRRSSIVARNQFSIGHILITFNVHLPTSNQPSTSPPPPSPPVPSEAPTISFVRSYLSGGLYYYPYVNDRSTSRTIMQVQPAQPDSLGWTDGDVSVMGDSRKETRTTDTSA